MSETAPILETHQVSKVHRAGTAAEVRAVQDVSIRVPRGAFVLLTGPSGSGKTTLLALLGSLERPTHGNVFFAGRDLHDCSDGELALVRQRMGFVFQDFALIPGLPVWENITYPLIPRGIRRSERYLRAEQLLARLNLAGKMTGRPRELSGGEQQRVAIARALAGLPELILADEPTSNLDEEGGRAVIALLRTAHGEGATVVVSSHDPRLLAVASIAIELEAGRIKRPADLTIDCFPGRTRRESGEDA